MKILPVIHHLDHDTSFDQAHLALEAGADGVFLISHNGRNDELSRVGIEIKEHMPQLKVGVNFLGWDVVTALDAAAGNAIDMLWLDAPGFDSSGIKAEGMRLLDRLSHYAGDHPEIFASVAFKYQPPEPIPSGAAALARIKGFIPTTSGPGTGQPPELQKIIDMFGASGPLAIASGMTPENIAMFVPHLSHVLVATGVSSDEHHFDYELLRTFIARARAAEL